MEMQDQISPDKLPAPQIITGIGNVSLEITGKPEAQRWFNQGLNLIHDFWDYEALRAFEQGVRAEKALGYHEPPNYIRPVQETVAAAMLAAGDRKNAGAAYSQALLERPHSGFALYGLALTSERSGETEQTVKLYRDFLGAWKEADQDLPQVVHAHEFLAAHSANVK
jgi:hypothetical protein